MHTTALGIWVGVGTRHEDMMHNGVAHMVEHMLFKGTKNRNALQIVNEIEQLGGSMNAYTSRELTSYHVHVLKDDVALGLEILCDMYKNSTLPDDEVERERDVILQEIGMCNDTPDDLVFDLFAETAYPDQSLGAPILGKAHKIEGMERTTLLDYICKHYTPANTVISAAGAIQHEDLVAQVDTLFRRLPPDTNQTQAGADYRGGEIRMQRDLEQAHFVMGFQGLSRLDDRYYAAQALSQIVGGGMSSRLFQEVREKRGLVYSIFSYHSGYQDDGQFGVYAGTDPARLDEIVPVICDELLSVAGSVTDEELQRAKSQLKAGTLMGRESMMSRADQHAKYLLFRDQAFDLEALVAAIDAISLADIQSCAQEIFASKPTLAALGPLDKLAPFEQIIDKMAA